MTGGVRKRPGGAQSSRTPAATAAPDRATPAAGAPNARGNPGGERQVPFFCPYCGEEELRPAGTQPGGWDCQACRRGFRLSFAGLTS